MLAYYESLEEILTQLQTNASSGLGEAEAKMRQAEYGENRLRAKKPKSLLQRFLDQFKDVMILILLAAAAVSFGIAIYEGHRKEFFEPILILLIVLLNAVLGVVQENKAQKALDALKSLSAPQARVIRDGKESILDAAQLTPGDIIRVEAGDFVPADCRLINSSSLKSEESPLTGESLPAEKDFQATVSREAPLGDRKNIIHAGCSITYGTGLAVVTAIGMDTEMGHIAHLLEEAGEIQTPLQIRLQKLGRYLGILALFVCAVLFVIGLIRDLPLMEVFMTAVSLAVAAIPEGLPAIVTVVLSIGVLQMSKKNAIIKNLPAVETLGSASVICSDKTGTLTMNQMTLVKVYDAQADTLEDVGKGQTPGGRRLLEYGLLCSNASVETKENGALTLIGDPTETAIVMAAKNWGMEKEELNLRYPRVAELPFDSDRKLMTTVHEMDGSYRVIVKGAFDVLANRVTDLNHKAAQKANQDMGESALRVLAIAYKDLPALPKQMTPDTLEQELNFLGLVGMIDPPRKEAREAVKLCKQAGITPVMITGDHVVTASAIAKEIGILGENQEAVSGAELSEFCEEQLANRVETISVYARVTPQDKIRIVKAWQKKGKIVSMTGDGVNDAPALKAADIGCAMGITGTDVAKGAADMILTDDNFATIVEAVKLGRNIYDNIRKTVAFLLGTNIGEVITVFCSMLFFQTTPLLSMQLLWINLVTDSLPAVALGMEPIDEDVMSQKPRGKEEGIFANGLGIQIVLQGILFAVLTLTGFWYGARHTGVIAGGQTMAFLVLATSQVVHAFNMRSGKSIFKIHPFSNKNLNLASLTSLASILLVLFVPLLRNAFGFLLLDGSLYVIGFLLAFLPLVILELAKFFGWVR